MDNITDVVIEPLKSSNYVIPLHMKYKQSGVSKIWDLITLHESVAIIIFHKVKRKLICVRQFRPAVYYNSLPRDGFLVNYTGVDTTQHPGSSGVTLEMCAGIVDTTKDLVATAQSEVLEECGYSVPHEKFERIINFRSGVGVSGDKQTLFYVEVDDSFKVNEGGGNAEEGEYIDVVEISITEVEDMLASPEVNSPGGFLFGLMWFMKNKAHLHS